MKVKNKNPRGFCEDFGRVGELNLTSWYNQEVDRVDRLVEKSFDLATSFLRWLVVGGIALLGTMTTFLNGNDGLGNLCNNMVLQCGVSMLALGILSGAFGLYGYVELRRRVVAQRRHEISMFLKSGGKISAGGYMARKKAYVVCEKVSFAAFGLAILGFAWYIIFVAL